MTSVAERHGEGRRCRGGGRIEARQPETVEEPAPGVEGVLDELRMVAQPLLEAVGDRVSGGQGPEPVGGAGVLPQCPPGQADPGHGGDADRAGHGHSAGQTDGRAPRETAHREADEVVQGVPGALHQRVDLLQGGHDLADAQRIELPADRRDEHAVAARGGPQHLDLRGGEGDGGERCRRQQVGVGHRDRAQPGQAAELAPGDVIGVGQPEGGVVAHRQPTDPAGDAQHGWQVEPAHAATPSRSAGPTGSSHDNPRSSDPAICPGVVGRQLIRGGPPM